VRFIEARVNKAGSIILITPHIRTRCGTRGVLTDGALDYPRVPYQGASAIGDVVLE
jgi:hypothetical protein